jgi:hypothetical protein
MGIIGQAMGTNWNVFSVLDIKIITLLLFNVDMHNRPEQIDENVWIMPIAWPIIPMCELKYIRCH